MSWESNYQSFKDASGNSNAATVEQRQKSFNLFVKRGLPTKKDEAWKYTSLSDFKDIEWKLHDENEPALTHEQMQQISKHLLSVFTNFVFVNGRLNLTLSDDNDGFFDLATLEPADFEFDEKNTEISLLNLSQAFLAKTINLNFSKQKTIEKPIQILFIQSNTDSVFQSDRLNVNLGENAEVKLIITTMSLSPSKTDAINLNINIKLEKSARLSFVQLQNENQTSFHFSQTQFDLNSSAQLTSLALSLGGRLIRNYFHVKFAGENARAAVYGLGVLDANQHLDNYTFLQHALGNNESVQHYKSILSGSSSSAFRGRVLIESNAQKAKSEQLNNNLLLTRTAKAYSVPQLEIFADDVKAGHGATFGQLNKDEIFYFLTRGINQYQAVKMLSYGFAKEMIYKIENEDIQNYLIMAFNQKLDSMVQNA